MDLLNLAGDLLGRFSPTSQSGLADYALFRLVSGWIGARVDEFALALMGRSMSLVGAIGLALVTLWLLIHGYRVVSGSSREPMMGLVVQGLKFGLIFGIATSMAVGGVRLNSFLTGDMDKAIHQLITGKDNESTAHSIDKSLAVVQVAMTAIDGVQLLQPDPELLEEKRSAKFMATMGSAAPAIAAGTMLLLWKFVMALWIGLGPIFILALAFPQTQGMFTRWLQYGLGTLFSMAVLSFVSNLLLELTVRVATIMWIAKLVNIPGLSAEGISNQAMQQGSIGMIMTMLIVSVPPVAAYFFNGQIGGFLATSQFGKSGHTEFAARPPVDHGRAHRPPQSDQLPDRPKRMDSPAQTDLAGRSRADVTTIQDNRIKSSDEIRKDKD